MANLYAIIKGWLSNIDVSKANPWHDDFADYNPFYRCWCTADIEWDCAIDNTTIYTVKAYHIAFRYAYNRHTMWCVEIDIKPNAEFIDHIKAWSEWTDCDYITETDVVTDEDVNMSLEQLFGGVEVDETDSVMETIYNAIERRNSHETI